MRITFAPKDRLQIDDARLIFRNFSGAKSQYNEAGKRNFAVVIEDEETAQMLIDNGWNVKIKPPREEGDTPLMYLSVKVNFNDYGPNVYLQTGSHTAKLTDRTVSRLDRIQIRSVDLDIRPNDWVVGQKSGRAAYLESMKVVQAVDRFAADLAESEYPEEEPYE